MDKESLLILAGKVANGTATEAELILYNQYYNYFQEQDEWDKKKLGERSEIESVLLGNINKALGFEAPPAKIIPFYRRKWLYAAVVALVMLTSTLFFLNNRSSGRSTGNQNGLDLSDNLTPGNTRATLTLADGSTVMLDSAQNGTIARQGDMRVLKLNDGQLVYRSPAGKQGPGNTASLNMLSTPRGGQYKLTLSDGSVVWLNSGSSLRFPAGFFGAERRVELKGEAYFEVAHNASMPFKVNVNEMEVTVLGTHFNIMGYEDEETVKTSLLQGSVKVQNDKATILLAPGQQSRLDKKGILKMIPNANMDEAVAWKDGLFYFDGVDIHTVMRQLARWYDVEVSYEGQNDQHFNGKINRDADISKVLQMLELTEKVHFRRAGKKVIVSQ